MPSPWSEFLHSRTFWLSYFSAGVDFSGCPSLQTDEKMLYGGPDCSAVVTFVLPDEHLLSLEISSGAHSLEILHPEYAEPQPVGGMDCHQMSDLFRWEEFLDLIRYLAKCSGPSWAHELFFSDYVAVTEDCSEALIEVLGRSLKASEVFTDPEVDHILAYTRRAIRKDFRWLDKPGLGWVAEGRDAYSIRDPRWGFDFERFSRMLRSLGTA